MKVQHLPSSLFVLTLFLFASCDPSEIESNSNYWNSNTLIRTHLNGKVKMVSYRTSNPYTDSYNQEGFITGSTYSSSDGTSNTLYNYASSGELISTSFVSSKNPGSSYTTTFVYGVTGKYVVRSPFHIMVDGLVPELKSTSNQHGRTDYVFNGNAMLLINTSIYNGITSKDTATVIYDGKYPTNITNSDGFVKDITYASNGMFLTYTEGFQGIDYSDESKYYFKPDNKFLLIDSIVYNSTNNSGATHSKIVYNYDSNRNILKEESTLGTTQYTYEYDSKRNWISKTTKFKSVGSSIWDNPNTITREITYW
jgi:hypothetical protein